MKVKCLTTSSSIYYFIHIYGGELQLWVKIKCFLLKVLIIGFGKLFSKTAFFLEATIGGVLKKFVNFTGKHPC